MESLLFHPKLVHLPIALAVLMPVVSVSLLIAWWRRWLPARAWWAAVALQAVLAGSALLAVRSGEAEEERVEDVVPESVIEEHEEAAELFLWVSVAALGLAVGAGLLSGRRAQLLAAGFSAATVVVLVLGYHVGEEGGELVYEHGAAAAYTASAGSGSADRGEHRGEHHDEDDEDDD